MIRPANERLTDLLRAAARWLPTTALGNSTIINQGNSDRTL